MRAMSWLVIAALLLTFGVLPHAGSQKPERSGSPAPAPPVLANPEPKAPVGSVLNPLPTGAISQPGSLVPPLPSTPVPPKTEAQKLRERYLELAKKHGDILSEEALQTWISQMEQRVLEDQASHEMFRARELLKDITKKYPETMAAREARQMLGLDRSPVYDGPSAKEDGKRK